MNREEILTQCLGVTGSFEGGGTPNYAAISGNWDENGMSVGILQFSALQGSVSRLCVAMLEIATSNSIALSVLADDIQTLAALNGADAKAFAIANYLDATGRVTAAAKQNWSAVLTSDVGIQAQLKLADKMYFEKALSIAASYVPSDPENLRVLAFFFDLVTQSGSMGNASGHVDPISDVSESEYVDAINFASQNNAQTAAYWQQVADVDDLAKVLLHYAFKRARLSKAAYVWDACSRRGAIACRGGVVHKHFFDFTTILP